MPEQGVFTAGINYFSGLFEIGKWKFRQFVKPQVTIGMNRFSYDSLTLKEGYGLNGFNSTSSFRQQSTGIYNSDSIICPMESLDSVLVRFLLILLECLEMQKPDFKTSKVYSQLGLGVLIKNENLVFNTFQISVSFYPLIPGVGQNVFKMNSYRTGDFGFRDFEIGKPSSSAFR